MCNKIYRGIEDNKFIRMVFLDASKAFDRVWHEGLLYKLKQLGVPHELVLWFSSYLSNRSQRVVIEGSASSWLPVEAGVPQGSILGPLLFLIYTNDIVDYIESEIFLYADDTSLLSISSDPVLSSMDLNADLFILQNLAHQWRITFNAAKTEAVTFNKISNDDNIPPLYLNGRPIANMKSHRHLGVILSENCSWQDHIDKVTKKASQRLGALQCLKYSLSRKSLEQVYQSYILPLLDYGDVLYDSCTTAQANAVENIHLCAARIVTGALITTNTDRLLKDELGWESLRSRRQRHKLLYLHRIIYNHVPTFLQESLPSFLANATPHALRHPRNLRLLPCRTIKLKMSFFPSSIVLWNNMPENLKDIPSVSSFKHALKSLFLPPTPPVYYGTGPRWYSVLHTRLRLKHNALSANLHRFGIKESPSCECNAPAENEVHYFFHCQLYVNARDTLLQKLDLLLFPELHLRVNNLLTTNKKRLLDLILCGSSTFPLAVNQHIFKKIYTFIARSQRFSTFNN